jgi:DNA-directed RNA polymerase specialized sigma24 family protein
MSEILRLKRRPRRRPAQRSPVRSLPSGDERLVGIGAQAVDGGTQTTETGHYESMSVRPAHSSCACGVTDAPAAENGHRAATIDPTSDFERLRGPATKRFIAMARAMGQHTFHDLDDRAQEFYADFWAEWLKRPDRELPGAPVAYIAAAMLNKLRQVNGRGRSVRPPELLRAEGDEILQTLASEDLDPGEQVILHEAMWQVNEILHTLPAREQVAFAAVFGRDSKKKGSPPGGYKLAAEKLGVSEVRAKKLSLAANKRIRAAADEIESGKWCERWADTIEQVAAGGEGSEEFLRHASHCAHCRLGVVHLRRQAAILPLPALALTHAHVFARLWGQLRTTAENARDQLALLLGRHGGTAADASGIVSTGGGAAGAGFTALKVSAVCLLAAGGAAGCLKAVGIPNPIVSALTGSTPQHHHRHSLRAARLSEASRPHEQTVIRASLPVTTTTAATTVSRPRSPVRRSGSTPTRQTPAQKQVSEARNEFNPAGGYGSSAPTGGGGSGATATTAARDTAPSTPTSESKPASGHASSSSSGPVTSGHSNAFSAP